MRTQPFIRQLGLAAIAGVALPFAVAWIQRLAVSRKGSKREDALAANRPPSSGEGSTAQEPYQIPQQGWADIVSRTYYEVERDRVFAVAAGVTFYGLLAIFPALTAFVSLYGLVADPATVVDHVALVQGFMPEAAVHLLKNQISSLTSGDGTKLGFALLFSLVLSIWSANAGVKAIFDALNVAYGEIEKRSFIRLNVASLIFTMGILLFAVLAIVAIAAVPLLLDFLHLGAVTEWVLWLGRWPLLIAVLLLGLAALYRFGPSRDEAQWTWVSPGALFASLTWLITSVLFSWYVANFEDYNKTYGALGAVIGLLMWMWISASIVLIGAELNSETERQTLHDTTKGPSRPMGMRGADAADSKA